MTTRSETAAGRAVPAETYAARKIAAALDLHIDPDVQVIADDSGLTVKEVRALVTKLHAKRMKDAAPAHPVHMKAVPPATPVQLQPVPDPEPAPPLAAVPDPDPVAPEPQPALPAAQEEPPRSSFVADDSGVPAAWLDHRSDQVRRLAEAARKAFEAVAAAVAEDASKDALYARRRELQAELDALDVQLGARRDEVPCPDCGMLLRQQGMGPHRARKHKAVQS